MPSNLGQVLGGVVNQRNTVAQQDLRDRTQVFQEAQAQRAQEQQMFQDTVAGFAGLADQAVAAAERDGAGSPVVEKITGALTEQANGITQGLRQGGNNAEASRLESQLQTQLFRIQNTQSADDVALQEANSTNITNAATNPTVAVVPPAEVAAMGLPEGSFVQRNTVTGEISVSRPPASTAPRASDFITFTIPGTDRFQTFNVTRQAEDIDRFLIENPNSTRVTSFGVSATSLEGLGADPSTDIDLDRIDELREDLRGSASAFASLGDAFTALEEPGAEAATGLRGMFARNVGGALQQAGPVGEALNRVLGMDPEQATVLRGRVWRVIAQNLERVTGEESGRYTEAERRIAANVLGNVEEATVSFEQLVSSLNDAYRIEVMGSANVVSEMLEFEQQRGAPIIIGTEDGDARLMALMRNNGIMGTDEQIAVGRELARRANASR